VNDADRLRLLHTADTMLQADLDDIEERFAIDLGRHGPTPSTATESAAYAQFPGAIRAEAKAMAQHYELFYCLENSIRELVDSQLVAKYGSAWWSQATPSSVRENVDKNVAREREAGVTPRSSDPIDYTTFGELGEIIRTNWDVFGAIFKNEKALSRVLAGLNLLRGPIAHCSPLAEDEEVRLELGLRDWFRLMS
jgi:hypothetical protein